MNDDHRDREGRDGRDRNVPQDSPRRDEPAPGQDAMFAARPGGASGLRQPEDEAGDAAPAADAPDDRAPDGRAPDDRAPRDDAPDGDAPNDDAPDGDRIPPLDEAAIAKHRAAKLARMRRRQAETQRQHDEAEGLRPDRAPLPASVPAEQPGRPGQRGSALPAIRPDVKPDTPALRAERVEAIRRDLVRRRRRKGGGLLLKLWAFVVVPTMAVAWFLWFQASDLYRSESSFVVQTAESAGGVGSSGGFFGALLGGGGGGIYDPIAVQTYILSRDVLHRLDADYGWIAHFQSPGLDILHRLEPDASFEDAFDRYKDMVSVSFDPTEGLLEMSVIAADPESARRFSQAIIGYSESMVDDLSNRIRLDAIDEAEQNLTEAEARLKAAQDAEAALRKELATFSVEGEFASEMGIISGLESQLEQLRGRLSGLQAVTSNADPRVTRLQGQVAQLESQIAERRAGVAAPGATDTGSLADINAALARAQLDVQAGMAIFTAALETRELARANASRQHRYLSVVAVPSLPDEPNYPQKWEVTALAFLGFLGLYIILSLTISLIREQASI